MTPNTKVEEKFGYTRFFKTLVTIMCGICTKNTNSTIKYLHVCISVAFSRHHETHTRSRKKEIKFAFQRKYCRPPPHSLRYCQLLFLPTTMALAK